MTITLELSDLEIKAMHNAAAAFGHEAFAMYLGCESWMRPAFEEKYPDKTAFELDEMITEQAKAFNNLVLKIEGAEKNDNN